MSSDQLKTVSMVSALFEIMSNDKDPKQRESKVKQQKKFFETIPGISFPEDWDQLPIEEREKRLKKIQDFNLKKGGLIMNRIWTKYINKMNIKETLLFIAEGVAFLLCLAAIYFIVMFGCVMVDSCYYYYVPGGGS
jgi:hypothetical protein